MQTLQECTAEMNSWLMVLCGWVSQVVLVVKNSPASAGDARDEVRSLAQEEPLEEEMASHSSIPA